MTDIDDQLGAYAERWRTAQPPPPQPVLATHSTRPRFPRFEHPARLVAIAATIAVVVAAVAAFAATRHPPSTRVSTANPPEVPVATPPLVFSPQPPPRMINLGASGLFGGTRWILFAGYLPKEVNGILGPGLCLDFALTGSGVTRCDNPATTPSLTANVVPLHSDPSMLLIAGVTSALAATFSVTLGTVSLSTPALTTTALPGLRFYVIQVLAADYHPSRGVTVEALSADGAALLRNDPRLTATLQPLG
jgi:hypothetical protein